MKKNLRIVSAAAAALLAVAPVAASAVSTVSAAAPSTVVNLGGLNVQANDAIKVNPSITLVGKGNHIDGSATASVTATVNGKAVTANLDATKADFKDQENGANAYAKNLSYDRTYTVTLHDVVFNVGTTSKVKLALPDDTTATVKDGAGQEVSKEGTFEVTPNSAGQVTLDTLTVKNVKPINPDNVQAINFFQREDNAVVTAGNVTINSLVAGSKLNVSAVVTAINNKYVARQGAYSNNSNTNGTNTLSDLAGITASEVADQLKKQNISVDGSGYFTAPKSFTINYSAQSGANNAAAVLPVTVNVPNGVDTTPAAVPSTGNVTIMHAAYTYEIKDGKLGSRVTSADTLHAYSEVPVYGTVTVNGKKYYRVSATQDYYINAGNVDGTSRSLKHNSYVYNNKGKRVKSEGTWKKGSKHTTYGAAMNIKGNRMYRVNKNRYVKVVNFD